jgi:hypothetical protein
MILVMAPAWPIDLGLLFQFAHGANISEAAMSGTSRVG